MPIDLNRGDVDGKLGRLTYGKGLKIKTEVAGFLAEHSPNHLFSADVIVARVEVAANPIMVESVLSHHPDVFSHQKRDGKLYWYVSEGDLEKALEIAENTV